MEKVRIAIVGCGTISQLNVPGYLRHPQCEVYALCDPLRQRAEQRARQWGIQPRIYTSYEDVLNDSSVDAVELLTPTYLHPQQAIAGLQAGKHVSCQKPIATTVAEADAIAAAVKQARTRFRVTENFLYYPPIVKARELLNSGAIGEPALVRIRTVRGKHAGTPAIQVEPEAYQWRRDPKVNAGGMLYDDGWHKYATAMWWLGDIEKVFGIVTRGEDFIREAPSAAIWKFKGRHCLGVLDYTVAEDMPIRARYYPSDEFFEIQGSKGAIWVTRCTGEMLDLPPVMLVKGTETVGFQVPMDWADGFHGAAADFIGSILQDRQPAMDVHFSRKVLQVILAVYEASRTERGVQVESVK